MFLTKVNFKCLLCPHSGALHREGRQCGGLDAAGDTCDCTTYVADLTKPMPFPKIKRVKPPKTFPIATALHAGNVQAARSLASRVKIPHILVEKCTPMADKPGVFILRLKHPYFKSKGYSSLGDKTWAIAKIIENAARAEFERLNEKPR